MIAWTPPVPVETTASGTPVLVRAAGQMALVIPDLSGTTAADARPVVREVGLPGRRLVAARGFTMLSGLATAAGPRIVVAGMQAHGRQTRGAILAGAPGARLRLVAELPGPSSKPFAAPDPMSGPGPPLDLFPAGNGPDDSLLSGVAVPVAVTGNPRGDIAVLASRWRGKSFLKGLELWLRRRGHVTVTKLSPPGRGLGAVAVALDPRGDALVAWKRARSVYARTLTGKRLSQTVRLAAADPGGPVRARLAEAGRGVVAWGSQDFGFDGPASAFTAFAVTLKGAVFEKPIALGSAPPDNGYGFGAGIQMSPLPAGGTALAWSGGGSSAVVQTAAIESGSFFRGPSAGVGRLEALATAADGTTAVVTSSDRRRVTLRSRAAAFDPPTDLGPTTGILAGVAFDASSHPIVASRDQRGPILVTFGR
jgi:hypothetical protein